MNRYARRVGISLLAAAIIALPAASVFAEKIGLEVQSSSVERDPATNEMVVVIELAAAGRTAFENYTERNRGRSLEISVGSTVLLRARLAEKISGGIIRANTKFSEDEAKKIAAQLTRGTMITLEDKLD
ncbi:MAG TPA: hypothetical protein PL193_05065 [Xanthobacteraceae bacterium]|nr:hypothetical protein [Xanthobacteraceae bacterium]